MKVRVKSKDKIIEWLKKNGYQDDGRCWYRKDSEAFAADMFRDCGSVIEVYEHKDGSYCGHWHWLPEWIDVIKEEESENDLVKKPAHYTWLSGVECDDVAKHFSFRRGQIIKYIWRAKHKGNELRDLKKAAYFLEREIKDLEGEKNA